jgi:hypothetical protein
MADPMTRNDPSWFQFRLRTLLVWMSVTGLFCAAFVSGADNWRAIVDLIVLGILAGFAVAMLVGRGSNRVFAVAFTVFAVSFLVASNAGINWLGIRMLATNKAIEWLALQVHSSEMGYGESGMYGGDYGSGYGGGGYGGGGYGGGGYGGGGINGVERHMRSRMSNFFSGYGAGTGRNVSKFLNAVEIGRKALALVIATIAAYTCRAFFSHPR